MKTFLYLLKCTDFILLKVNSEDCLQLPVIASIVLNIPIVNWAWGNLKTCYYIKIFICCVCCFLNEIWPESLKKKKQLYSYSI